jgi:hypothetical protein
MGISYDLWRSLPGVKDDPERLAMHPDSPLRASQFKGGTKGVWRITIPWWHPVRLNELIGMHWSQIARLKKEDRGKIQAYLREHPIPPATGPRRVHLAITLGKGQRGGDPDCYWKGLLDTLVNTKLLVDDSKEYVVLDPVDYIRAKEPETTIELTDL